MKKSNIIYLILIGLIGVLTSCKKDQTMVNMLTSPAAPALKTIPDMTLSRVNGSNMLTFVGTPVKPGFTASANYFLEACVSGNNFADSVVVWTGVQDTAINIVASDLNGILLKIFPADQVSSADFRIRSVLVVDAGTGAPGTIAKPFIYKSATSTVNVSPYGFPRLDLINSGITQKIESPLADTKYAGYVYLDATKSFTLHDSETGIDYGATGLTLVANGSAFSVAANGWYRMTANTTTLTYTLDPFNVGLVGSATPNGWNSPDQKMTYNPQTGTWDITITLVAGDIKFRLNDDWAWNLGGTTSNLTHNGANYTLTAGNYTFHLTITVPGPNGSEAGKFDLIKNSR